MVSYSDLNTDEADFLARALHEQSSAAPPPAGVDSARELIEKLLQSLNPREQMAIRLLDLQECSVQEACELTGWSPSKVKVTAMRARRKLTRALDRLERDQRP